ncbi:MAG: hypothetical protein H0W89_06255 [Candidatus Levybacteria bacterium]|nr:hypothetical protein [Candidatus Levybacteria bacterium]
MEKDQRILALQKKLKRAGNSSDERRIRMLAFIRNKQVVLKEVTAKDKDGDPLL